MLDTIINSAKDLLKDQLPKISAEIQRYLKKNTFDPVPHVTGGQLKLDQLSAVGEVTIDYSVDNLTGLSAMSIEEVDFDFDLSGADGSSFDWSSLLGGSTQIMGNVGFSIQIKDHIHADLSGTLAATSRLFDRKDNFTGGVTFTNNSLQAKGSIVISFDPIHRSVELEDIHINELKPGYETMDIDLDGLEKFGMMKGLILNAVEKAAKLEIGDLAGNSLRVLLNRALDQFEHKKLELSL